MNLPVFLIGALTSNLIFTRALGMSTLVVSSKSNRDFIGTGLAITLFTTIGAFFASLLTPFTDAVPLLRPLCYLTVIALLYVAALLILHACGQAVFVRFRKYIHISAFNCAVLGAMLLAGEQLLPPVNALLYGLQAGIGFLIASFILKAVYPSLTSEQVPASVRGYPAILIYMGILAMALYQINQ